MVATRSLFIRFLMTASVMVFPAHDGAEKMETTGIVLICQA